MKIIEVEATNILTTTKNPSAWFGVKYNMNVYRGCEHKCIYCDSRSECYRINRFDTELLVKKNAPFLLRKELSHKKAKGIIGTGAMSDPYTYYEEKSLVMRKCLEVISEFKYPLNIITKSNLILRDLDLLEQISKAGACVVFTITTTDDTLSKIVEPYAPLPSKRLKAMKILSEKGIKVGVTLMPVLPFLEDTEKNILSVVREVKKYGGNFIIPGFGVTLRDRQRDYFYKELEKSFPNLKEKYEKKYGNNYSCSPDNVKVLKSIFEKECSILGLETKMRDFANEHRYEQLEFKF